jgi:hypothetical protein
MDNIFVLDNIISQLRSSFDSEAFKQLKGLSKGTLMLGMPALLSSLFKCVLDRKSPQETRELVRFIDYCVCDVCSDDFIIENVEKIDILFKRLLDAFIIYDTFRMIKRFLSLGIAHQDIISHVRMLFVYYGTIECDVAEADLREIANKMDYLRKYKVWLFIEDDNEVFTCELLTGMSCLHHEISFTKFSRIKPSCLLRISPLLDDYEFYELTIEGQDDMILFFAKYSNNVEIIANILAKAGGQQHASNDMNAIAQIIYKRHLLPDDIFIDLCCFVDDILDKEENQDLVINKV